MAIDQKQIRNFTAFNLSAPPLDGGTKRSSLLFSERGGFPRITVFFGENLNRGNIYAPMDLTGMLYLLDNLITLCSEEKGTKRIMSCSNMAYDQNGQREVVKIADVYYGKDDEGVMWISLVDKRKEAPKIKFEFEFNKFIGIYDKEGKEVTDKGLLSTLACKAKCEALKKLYVDASMNVNLTVQQQKQMDPPTLEFAVSKAASPSTLDEIMF